MSEAITAQPSLKKNYEPVGTADEPDAENDNTIPNSEEKEKNKRKRNTSNDYVDPDCCCFIGEDDFLFQFLLCRMISNCFVGWGRCTEDCCDSCCKCLCNCNEGNADNINVTTDSGCDCGDCDCGGCDCGECDCGDCDCGDCDCGGCDCFS